MFGFDDDFGLDDLIEADIKFGLFEDDEKVKLLKRKKENLSILINKYTHLSEKLEECYINIQQILKKSSYSEKGLFRAYCKIADIQEKMFYFLKEKLEKDYEFIINFVENNPHNTDKIEEHVETFCDEYDELEACVSELYETTIFLEAEEEYESEYEHYSEIHFQLESDLADIEDLKFELEMLDY